MSNVVEKADGKKESWWQRNRGKVFLIGGIIFLGIGGAFVWYKIHGSTSAVILSNQPLPLQTPVQQISETLTIAPALAAMSEAQEPVRKIVDNAVPLQVCGHIRKLHTGWSASEKQRQLAATLGYVLGEGETFVSPYVRKLCA